MNQGARVEPFRGLLYNQAVCEPLSALVAPPYDLIGPARQAELYDRSPYNVVRLELNRDPDRYASAARLLKQWISTGALVRAATPAIYLYTQVFTLEERRLRRDSLIARIKLEKFSSGRILPHERTFSAPKEDRIRLLAATRANLSPIFGLYTDVHPALDRLRERVQQRPPLLVVTDDLGIDNHLRAIEDPEEIALVQRDLESARVLIADGHHRYETALAYCGQRRSTQPSDSAQPYDYVMMSLAAADDPGLVILPTHRVVKRIDGAKLAEFSERAREFFDIDEISERRELEMRLGQSARGAIGIALRGRDKLMLARLKSESVRAPALAAMPPAIRTLDVSILHSLVLDRLLGIDAAQVKAGRLIEYTTDVTAALEAVRSEAADAAFLMNPPSIVEVDAVCQSGATMPEKSTYFHPKLLTGLVMNLLTD